MTVRRGPYRGPRNRPWSVQNRQSPVVEIQPHQTSSHAMSDAFNRVKPGDEDELVTVRLPRSILNQLLQEQTMSGSNPKSAAAANDTANTNTQSAEDQLRGETTAAIDEQLGGLNQEREELEGRLSGVRTRINRLLGAKKTATAEGEEASTKSSFGRKFAKVSLVVLGVGAAAYGGVLAYKRWAPQS